MNKALTVIVSIPALLFILVGIGWLLVPSRVAAELGMPLLDGLGGSTQIGDLGAFFLCGGLIVIIGLVTQKREWFYAAALLLAGAAFFRTASWVLHDMPFATPQVAIEVILTVLMLFAASRLAKH
ncbi:MAG: hypothetical protein V7746_00720 [Halioglobus sp.]